ncbi:hypothetical protein N0B51_07200 [Tsuneonella sp. YG55]|uniref:Lipoprotein n=1 Tax=Tsuneonella litorea TaxID=2976475 RepID=A0A9X2W1E7_9SPHN|nr:hypothetical protein [Tsuneonella litorea]MCT2558764.1 hypothetical protein [Tsuneonella litorea]
MRLAVVAILLALAACGRGATQSQAAEGATRIECALGEGSRFSPDCLVERVQGEEGSEFVVRHGDGKFRRFRIAPDRHGMVAIAGADDAVNAFEVDPPILQVTVGSDRYRFPADIDAAR